MLEKDLVLFLVTLSVFTYTEHTHIIKSCLPLQKSEQEVVCLPAYFFLVGGMAH